MNAKELLKIAAVAVFTTSFAVGCASGGSESTSGAEVVAEENVEENEGASAEAKRAIYAAKLKNARARNLGFGDTWNVKLIKAAEEAAASGDNDRAIVLAKRAEDKAAEYIAEYHAAQASSAVAEPVYLGSYLVESGDNLWNIAGQDSVYGNPYQWPLIYKANVSQINDADLIFAGQSFNIPKATADESAAAIQHAKSRGAWAIDEIESSDLDYIVQ
jgi:nucleoid-associated protein YgaU